MAFGNTGVLIGRSVHQHIERNGFGAPLKSPTVKGESKDTKRSFCAIQHLKLNFCFDYNYRNLLSSYYKDALTFK